MNSRDRVSCSLNHKEGDRIPLDLGAGKSCKLHAAFYGTLLKHLDMDEKIVIGAKAGQLAVASDDVLERLQCDVRCAISPFRKNSGVKTEEWEDAGYRYYRDDWGTVMRMPKNMPLYYDMYMPPREGDEEVTAQGFAWPEVPQVNPASVEQAKRHQAAGYPVILSEHFGNGFLQNGPKIFGFNDWLVMLSLEEDRVRGFLDRLLELKMRYFDNVFDAFGDALDIVAECDDLGTQNAPFVSPEMFRSLFKPYWKKLFEHIRSRSGAKILLHSCGACEPLVGDLVDLGLDVLNPVQISAAGMDPFHLKKEFGDDLSFWGGGVDTQRVLPYGTPREIRDNVKRNIDALSKNGGFIFATVHNVQADVPVKNFMAMWEAFMEFRDYR